MINKIDISGEWGFRADEDKVGIEKEYYLTSGNDTINLPSTTAISRKGNPNNAAETGYLTDSYAYEGYAWYYKTIDMSGIAEDKKVQLYLERTRLTSLWINGRLVGNYGSLCTPHVYDITEYINNNEINITIMVSNTDYPTRGGHMTSADTQSNWNGITGEISLIISEKKSISEIQAYPEPENGAVRLKFELEGTSDADISVWGASSDSKIVDKQTFHISGNSGEAYVKLGEVPSLWSEFNPVTYTLMAVIDGSADISKVTFGLSKFTEDGINFLINGEKTQLRGKHDGLIFPLTGAAPTDIEEWLRILGIAKSWGINHYRFHTCCPPEAAFTAADMLGIYMQPELPFWGTITTEQDENHNESEQQYLIEEGRRILKTFGNHPSFVMMSLGNELWGSSDKMAEILREYHSVDNRHLYTQGSNNFQFWPNILPEDDFFSGVRLSKERLIRGSYATCDAPLGFVQTDEPNTVHSYDELIFPESVQSGDGAAQEIEIQYGTGVKKVKIDLVTGGLIPSKPIITHEVGQYAVYPDFNEIEKYTGVMKARNFEVFRERLAEKGMLSLSDKFFKSSGKLSAQCYKLEIEAAMRSEYIAGFQLLDLQDFSGQGTALVGMLDAFMDSKNLIERENWNGFCSDAVILAEIKSFIVTVGEQFNADILFRYTGGKKLVGKVINWKALCGDNIVADGVIAVPDDFYGLGKLGEVSFIIPETSAPQKIKFVLEIERVRSADDNYLSPDTSNSYELWAYPESTEDFSVIGKSVKNNSVVYITESLDETKKLLEAGEKVIYLPNELKESIQGFYCTDFWCYPMFRSISESMGKAVPVGTMGLLIDNSHPALSGFASDDYSTPQWYHIVTHAECAVLDDTPEGFVPIVQMIDNFERNHKLGLLYEAKVGEGRLIVCTSRLSELSERAEVQAFVKSILDYAHSENFEPQFVLDYTELCLG